MRSWNVHKIYKYSIIVHPQQKYSVHETPERTFLLIGHAYNPFTLEHSESEILQHVAQFDFDSNEYRDYFDQITGVFFFAVFEGNSITATCDCAGLLGSYYAIIDGEKCFGAYSQMIADVYDLEEDLYVSELKKSKLFRWYGWYLPGDLTPYSDVKRIIPNTEVRLQDKASIQRFYPRKRYEEVNGEEYDLQVEHIGRIMNNSLRLITEKWANPAISLTGGTDSKTTLACAKGVQDHFSYFSYVSLPREETDALAARDICKALGLRHKIYYIDTDPARYDDFETVSNLLERHYSYLGKAFTNDICKRIVLKEQFDYDVEVKSWVSEIARASRYKKYGKKSFPCKIRPRMLTSMYKFFAFDRRIVRKTDKVFGEYLVDTGLYKAIEETGYPWTEFFVWEIVFGGWGSLALTGEHMLTNEITVPYNNRALLDLMLRTPLSKRLDDQLHKDIMHSMDDRIEKLGIHVVNGNETKQRELIERVYYRLNNIMPF
ncbi:MAG: hypothetical protein IKP26_08210 [Clostridia bacterium]|nr:hypothetical protein [Clostridia bacterium]